MFSPRGGKRLGAYGTGTAAIGWGQDMLADHDVTKGVWNQDGSVPAPAVEKRALHRSLRASGSTGASGHRPAIRGGKRLSKRGRGHPSYCKCE